MLRVYPYALALILSLLLSGCVPELVPVVQAPGFSVKGELQVVSFEPPLIGSGQVVLRLPMEVYNPNTFELSVTRLDFDLSVNSRVAITSSTTQGLSLVSQGSAPFVLDIAIPLKSGIQLIADIAALRQGQTTSYQLDGSVTADVLNAVQVFAKTTLVSGQVN
ncbi:MAG: LEA type 2 family protein [Trueperaceae bacterium]